MKTAARGDSFKTINPLIRKLLFTFLTGLVTYSLAVAQAPTGVITYSFLSQNCAGVIASFNSNPSPSSPGPISFAWSASSPQIVFQAPNSASTDITFPSAGTFTITCAMTNSFGTTNLTQQVTINPNPVANFIASDSMGCFPMTVNFTDQSSGGGFGATLASWTWDPGTGNIYSGQNPPPITYNNITNATVTLIVKNNFGCSGSLTKPGYIKVNQGVVPGFSSSISSSCKPPTAVTFTNSSTGPPTLSYVWKFGDGSTANTANASHVYTAPGSNTVTLIVTSTAGCTDSSSTVVTIGSGNNQSNFSVADSVCVGAPVNFVNTSNPLPGSSLWKYGDGNQTTGFNGNHSYGATGTYSVTLVNNYGTCTDSFSKPILVMAPPVANFSAIGSTVSCSAPLTVQFQNQTSNSSSWTWDFGDGTGSNAQNPVHTYTSYGQFTVTLSAANASGCSNTLIKNAFVNITKPVIKVTNLPFYGCAPVVFTPTYVDTVADGISSLFWDFGNGNTYTGLTPPSQTYTAGLYPVKVRLTTTGGCVASFIDTVKVGNTKPTALFNANPTTSCRSGFVQFSDLSTGGANQWLWQFGDGGTSSLQDPSYQYSKSGSFTVTLIAYNNGCQDTLVKPLYITVNPPYAKFAYSFACGKNSVNFSDSSQGANSWNWDFGDNSPQYNGTVAQPSPPVAHVYPTSGNYTARLIVHNNSTNCSDTSYQTIVFNQPPTLMVENSPPICKGTTVQFGTQNYQLANTFIFNFGDGTPPFTYQQASVQHLYPIPGVYTASLIATMNNGCYDTSYATVTVNGPTANFSVNDTISCRPFTASFVDSSKSDGRNPIVNWQWNFGDGSPVTGGPGPVSHSYAQGGIYSTSLRVTDASGCADSVFKPNYIVVSIIKANFTSADSTCPGAPVQFKDSSTGGFNPTYFWDFGNGATSTAINPPSQSYAANGKFVVKHAVTDMYGCSDTIPKTIVVGTPSASFTMSSHVANCPPLQVLFNFTGSYYQSLVWNFDGVTIVQDSLNPRHIYNIPNTYSPTLTVISPGGCQAKFTDTVTIYGPQLNSFNYAPLGGCDTLTVDFAVGTSPGVIKYQWNYGDNSGDSTTVPTTRHFYVAPANYQGYYLPSVTLTNDSGCSVTYFQPDTIVVVSIKPIFGINRPAGCVDNAMVFTDSTKTNGRIVNYFWDFGDGQTLNGMNPVTSHTYTAQGNYTAKMVVTTQFGCEDSVTKSFRVVNNPSVDIAGAVSQCVPASINFNGVVLVPDTSSLSWSWDFSNGATAVGQSPPTQVYPKPGNYTVQTVATNSSGCTDTASNSFFIYPLPTVFAGNDTTICLGDSLLLMATGASTYNWLPPSNSTLSCPVCANTIATPTVNTTYIVNGTSINGCQAKDTVVVNVNQPVTLTVSPSDSVCVGKSTQLTASGAALYTWSPAGSLNNPTIPNPVALPASTTTYQVIGSDNKFCFYDTQYVTVSVFNYPTVNLGPDATILVGSSYQINGIGSPDIVSINWTPVTGLSCTNCLNPLASPLNSTNYVVDVVNNGRCAASDTLKLTVICNDNNIFVPNTFSPNGDGVNDIFYVRGKGLNTIPSMTIYNRWGQIVFQKKDFAPNDPSAGWDGTINGKKAPIDVYIYTIEIICDNSSLVPYHGNVALIR